MPRRPPHPCNKPGCPNVTTERWCTDHAKPEGARFKRFNREQMRQYDQQRGSASARGYGSKWRKIRAAHLAKHPQCSCGAKATVVDHVIPKRQGGTDAPSNLQSMCASCHPLKTNLSR